MKSITAKCVTIQRDGDIAMVGFADDEYETTSYLLLQKSLKLDGQDQNSGHDQIHIELDSPSQSGYGGVESMSADRTTLIVELSPIAGDILGTSRIEVDYSESSFDFKAFKECLALVVGNDSLLSFS